MAGASTPIAIAAQPPFLFINKKYEL